MFEAFRKILARRPTSQDQRDLVRLAARNERLEMENEELVEELHILRRNMGIGKAKRRG